VQIGAHRADGGRLPDRRTATHAMSMTTTSAARHDE
jgi:hypothetical protein